VFCVLVSCLLTWCWGSWSWESLSLDVYWFELKYDGEVNLERVALKKDDMDEILDLYQEVWNDSEYKDSLLVAEKYAQWLWANAFAQDNIDTLKNQWLTLADITKTQIWIEMYGEKINAVLVEYEITEWFIKDVPLLYISQLFIPDEDNMILMSFITENKSSHLSASNMFKNIKY
jgi:hypothetical protein